MGFILGTIVGSCPCVPGWRPVQAQQDESHCTVDFWIVLNWSRRLEICSYKLDHVSEVGSKLSTKLIISACQLPNMLMHAFTLSFKKKEILKNANLLQYFHKVHSTVLIRIGQIKCTFCCISRVSCLFPFTFCVAGSQMPSQAPGSQPESSSHPALSQSPMPQDRGSC